MKMLVEKHMETEINDDEGSIATINLSVIKLRT